MIKVNDTDASKNDGLSQRLHRRSLLKAGAIAVPIVVTLHGGVPLAHADSAGLCVVQLIEIAEDSGDARYGYLQVPMLGGQVASPTSGFSHDQVVDASKYPDGTVLESFNASPEHWRFIASDRNRFGFSCINSITNNNNTYV